VNRRIADLKGPTLPPLVGTLHYGLFPAHYCRQNLAAYGRAYAVTAMGGQRFLMTSDPEHIRRIFSADEAAFRSVSELSLKQVFGRHSVLITHGPTHQRQRKLLAPPLSAARLRGFASTMRELAEERVLDLRRGERVSAHALTLRYTLDVIVRTVFGVTAPGEAEALRARLTELAHIPPLPIFVPTLQRPWFPPWRRFLERRKSFADWVDATIAARRARGEPEGDVLSSLMAARYDDGSPLEPAAIHDQLITLLLAGHETTAITLARCLERVHAHPHVLETLQAELTHAGSDGDALLRLPYLSAVIDETLRTDPIVTDVGRIANQRFELGDGLALEPGDAVLVLIEALHRDPALYPDPEAFRPERFLTRRFQAHEYAPFGGGVRRCLGATFSDWESKIFLAALLRSHRFAPLHRGVSRRVRRNVTMGPAHDVPLRVVS
jgi:cytochrome P450 family 110